MQIIKYNSSYFNILNKFTHQPQQEWAIKEDMTVVLYTCTSFPRGWNASSFWTQSSYFTSSHHSGSTHCYIIKKFTMAHSKDTLSGSVSQATNYRLLMFLYVLTVSATLRHSAICLRSYFHWPSRPCHNFPVSLLYSAHTQTVSSDPYSSFLHTTNYSTHNF